MRRNPPIGRLCAYCGSPADQWHEEFPQREANVAKYGKKLIYHPINCKPSCNRCNVGHANVVTKNEYEFVVGLVEAHLLTEIPYKMDAKALRYVREQEARGMLKIIGNNIRYEATA